MFARYEGGEALGYAIVIFMFIGIAIEFYNAFFVDDSSKAEEYEEEDEKINPNVEAEEIDI